MDRAGSDGGHTIEWGGQGRQTALYDAVQRRDLSLVRMLVDRGATKDEDAFYHACESSDLGQLELLYVPGHESCINHKLDFEDVPGLRWFLGGGTDVNANRCLHHAICRGRGTSILRLLIDAGADVNLPWDRWDVGRRPLALAARWPHRHRAAAHRPRGRPRRLRLRRRGPDAAGLRIVGPAQQPR